MRWEGEAEPLPDPLDQAAIGLWNLLANGMGGLDWAGLPIAVELLGLEEIEPVLQRLLVIKLHEPPERGATVH